MAWTYGGDPTAKARDAVRYLCGDTKQSKESLQDGEIDFHLVRYEIDPAQPSTKYQGLLLIAAECCLTLASRYADQVNFSADGVSASVSSIAAEYRSQAARLRHEAYRGAAPVFATNMAAGDFSHVFTLGMMTNTEST